MTSGRTGLVTWGLAFLVLWWAVLLGAGVVFDARWAIVRAEWDEFAAVGVLVSALLFAAFLMLTRAQDLTALGLALIGVNSLFVIWFSLAIARALWPGLPITGRSTYVLEFWIVGVALMLIALLIGTADPLDVPAGRTVARRAVAWVAVMALVFGSILLAGRFW